MVAGAAVLGPAPSMQPASESETAKAQIRGVLVRDLMVSFLFGTTKPWMRDHVHDFKSLL